MYRLTFADLALEVRFKDIKHLHLSVHPPQGTVMVAAPISTDVEVIRAFVINKIGWIRRQQRQLQQAERAPKAEFLERESHYVWGQRYLLHIEPCERSAEVSLSPKHLTLHVGASASQNAKAAVLSKWYRKLVKSEVSGLVDHWAKVLRVSAPTVRVRKMKTKWGSCNHRVGTILINTDLGKKPKACLEYVVLHEMAHLIEPTHSERFTQIMDRMMPTWRARRDLLNSLAAPPPK